MSLIAGLKHSRTRNPQKLAIVFGQQSLTHAELTYAEFDELTNNVASNLLAAGLESGDRIALHLLNGPELAIAYFGVFESGGNCRTHQPAIEGAGD